VISAVAADPQIVIDLKRRKLVGPSAGITLSDEKRQIEPLFALRCGGLRISRCCAARNAHDKDCTERTRQNINPPAHNLSPPKDALPGRSLGRYPVRRRQSRKSCRAARPSRDTA